MEEQCVCEHCGMDLVNHHHRNLKCPTGDTVFRDRKTLATSELLKSFDARVWAKDFVEHVKKNPAIPTDEETMVGWFASALMRGYDEHRWRGDEYKRYVRRVLVPWWKRWFVPLSNFGH